MSLDGRTIGGTEVTPMLIAYWFWEMNSEEQADFFGKLHQISDGMLCQQTAYLVAEIRRRASRGDGAPLDGFQRMFAHSAEYVEDGIESRVWDAKHELQRLVTKAKGEMGVSHGR